MLLIFSCVLFCLFVVRLDMGSKMRLAPTPNATCVVSARFRAWLMVPITANRLSAAEHRLRHASQHRVSEWLKPGPQVRVVRPVPGWVRHGGG